MHDPAALFQMQNSAMDLVRERGMQTYVSELGEIAAAFALQDRTVRCNDEGTPGGVRFAGSGILAPFEDAVAWMKAAGVDGVTSHVDCDDAVRFCAREGMPPSMAEAQAKVHAESLADALGVPYVAHITTLDRPHFHDARVAYYDGTGSLDPSRVEGLPKGFVISRRYLEPAYAAQEATVACQIALGEHGFGALFTPDAPFLLIAVAGTDGPGLVPLQEELAPVVAQFGGRVALDGFLALAV